MPSNGDSQPPKNISEISAEINTMLAYSPKKNKAKVTPEYSTWKPATSSDSPSPRRMGDGWFLLRRKSSKLKITGIMAAHTSAVCRRFVHSHRLEI